MVGTPGRLAEFVRQGAVQLHRCPLLVLDEADQLLAANFVEDMGHITDHCGKKVGGCVLCGVRSAGLVHPDDALRTPGCGCCVECSMGSWEAGVGMYMPVRRALMG